jgi:hypothetical protein
MEARLLYHPEACCFGRVFVDAKPALAALRTARGNSADSGKIHIAARRAMP